LKIDPAGAKILGGIGRIGGMIAMDGEGNFHVTVLPHAKRQGLCDRLNCNGSPIDCRNPDNGRLADRHAA